jgi:hypothetical protein
LLRHRSRTRFKINASEKCPLPPSYVQLGTLTHYHPPVLRASKIAV